MRRGPGVGAVAGGVALVVGLWLPWFHRRLSSVVAPVRAVVVESGWRALGLTLGMLLLAVAALALVWTAVGTRRPGVSGTWLVIPGGLALLVEIGVTVGRVGAEGSGPFVTTTTPALGLLVAFGGAVAVVLAGLVALLAQSSRRA